MIPYKAEEVRFKLRKLQSEYLLDLEDVVVAVRDEKGIMVGASDQFSLQGRVGLRVGMHFALNNGMEFEPYVKVSAVHEFLTGDQVTVNESGFNPTISGTLVDAAVGLSARVSRSVYLYGKYNYDANGDRIR